MSGADRSRPPRSPVFLTAELQVAARSYTVRVRNLSDGGALIDGASAEEGAPVVFRRGEVEVAGRVVWSDGTLLGIAFEAPLDRADLMRSISPPQAQPQAAPDTWRPGFRQKLSRAERAWMEGLTGRR